MQVGQEVINLTVNRTVMAVDFDGNWPYFAVNLGEKIVDTCKNVLELVLHFIRLFLLQDMVKGFYMNAGFK